MFFILLLLQLTGDNLVQRPLNLSQVLKYGLFLLDVPGW